MRCKTHEHVYESTECLVGGKWIGTPCPLCEKEEEAAERKKEAERRLVKEQLAALKSAGIPKRFRGKDFSTFSASTDGQRRAAAVCKKYADNFTVASKNGICMTMCGHPGTGKTHLACSIGNLLISQGRSVLFIGALDMLVRVKETWNGAADETEREVIEKFVGLDLLIIDEVGVQYGKEAEKIILFQILNRRYEEVKPTIVISNLMGSDLDRYLGERIIDRLNENNGPTLAFDWSSWRTRKNKKET
jgi:DNA replication protein DnaC